MLVAETDLGYLFIALYFLRLVQAALRRADTKLPFRVVTKREDIAVIGQETGETLTSRDALHVVSGDLVDGNSSWSVDAIHVAICLVKSWTVLI